MCLKYVPIITGLMLLISGDAKEEGKIINGKQVQIENFPYQVSLQNKRGHFCGGSIYKKSWIITAAHCLQPFNGSVNDLTIVAGQTKLSDTNGQRIPAASILLHPNYTGRGQDYDVALLKLARPLTFNGKVRSIRLPGAGVEAGMEVVVTGWGTTIRGGGGKVSDTLLAARVTVQFHFLCEWQYFLQLTDRMFCAGYVFGGSDTCQGDSGGPANYNNTLVGIVSFGRGCGNSFSPGVYTNIFVVKSFILNNAT